MEPLSNYIEKEVIYGSTVTRSAFILLHMMRRPFHAVRWLSDRLSPKTPIEAGLPWLSWPCIDYIRRYLRKEYHVFEWGGGGSTVFFAAAGCRVCTVESDEYWKNQIEEKLNKLGSEVRSRVEIVFIPAKAEQPEAVRQYVAAVRRGTPWDLILVDGLEWDFEGEPLRLRCTREAAKVTRVDAPIVLDNAAFIENRNIPVSLAGFERREFWGLGPGRRSVTKTDVYIRRSQDRH